MPRSPTIKTYDHLFLEKLSRSQIQVHAKRNSIKANGKTEAIISQLLGKQIITEESPAPIVDRSTRRGTRRNHINIDNAAGDVGASHQVAKTKTENISPSPSMSQIKRSLVSFAQQPNAQRNPTSHRRGTPYPQSGFGSESSSDSGTRSPTYPVPASEIQAAGVPMEQTDSDVRIVRRRLTMLVDQQVSLQREIDNINLLLEYSQRDIRAATEHIEHLAWTRQAIEEVVMLDLKDDRQLWDGTGQMCAKDEKIWRRFVEDNWIGRPRWQPDLTRDVLESDSSSIASSIDSGTDDTNNASQELIPTEDNGVVDDEDDEDSIYV